jgi:hypothetical protein
MRFYFFFIIIGRERERVERVERVERSRPKKKTTTTLTLTLVIVVVVYVAFRKTAKERQRKSGGKERQKFLRDGKNSFDRKIFFQKAKVS